MTKSYTLTHGNQKVFSFFFFFFFFFGTELFANQIFMREELIESKYAFPIAAQYLSLALKWESQSAKRWEERIKKGGEGVKGADSGLCKSLKERQQRFV